MKRIVAIGLICCLCIFMVGTVVADSESLRAANAIDTPEETPVSGTTINHIGVFEQGEEIEATITGPDETYDIGLFDSSDTEIANQTGVSETVTFDSSDLSPGSYMLSVTNTAFDYVAPIVISGYDIDVELTEETSNNELTIDSTVTETALQGAPHQVDAVVWNDDAETRIELTTNDEFSSSAEYDGTVSLDEFDGESYEVYVVATSEDEIYQGENEILAIGEASVSNGDDSDDGLDDSDGSNGTDDGSDEEDDETDGSNESDEEDDTDEPNESDAASDDTDDVSSVIEPNTSTDEDGSAGQDDSVQSNNDSINETDDKTPHSIAIPIASLLLISLGIARVNNQQ